MASSREVHGRPPYGPRASDRQACATATRSGTEALRQRELRSHANLPGEADRDRAPARPRRLDRRAARHRHDRRARRVYDYVLGGTTNFEADRAASHAAQLVPGGHDTVTAGLLANRRSWPGRCAT